jgi:hypothetical protein
LKKKNWKGHIIISFQKGQEFILKATGTFLTKYVLEDQDRQKVMLLNPDFNWAKFSYNYSISYAKKPQDILLVLLATYSAITAAYDNLTFQFILKFPHFNYFFLPRWQPRTLQT